MNKIKTYIYQNPFLNTLFIVVLYLLNIMSFGMVTNLYGYNDTFIMTLSFVLTFILVWTFGSLINYTINTLERFLLTNKNQ